MRALIFLFLSSFAFAQFTQVNGTVTDPNGLPYSNGTIAAKLVLPGGTSPTLNGLPYTPPSQPVGLDSTGSFVMQLADNSQLKPNGTQWNFTVCSAAGTIQPAGGRGPLCFTVGSLTIGGSTQSITTQLTAAALPLAFGATPGNLPGASASGQVPVSTGAGTTYAAQTKPAIDVRDKGVDCTGVSTSDAALNALTGTPPGTDQTLSGTTIIFPAKCIINLSATWLIKNQLSIAIDCLTRSGAGSQGPSFKWTGASGGTEIDFEFVDGFEMRGCVMNGNNLAGVGINVDKTGAGGITNTTDGIFRNMTFGSGASGWIGILISNISGVNVEDMRVEDSTFYCNNVTNSVGIEIGASPNAKNEIFKHNNFATCFYGVYQKSGSMSVTQSEFSSNGGTCGSGTGADIRIDGSTDVDTILSNLDEGGTQFINVNNDVSGGPGHPVIVEGNHSAPAGCENLGVFWLNTGKSGNNWIIEGNSWDSDANLTKLIGTSGGTGATINVRSNLFPNLNFTSWWTNGTAPGITDVSGSAITTNQLFTNSVVTPFIPAPGNSFYSPIEVFRGYLNGSVSTFDDFGIQGLPANGVGNAGSTFLIKHQQGTTGTSMFAFDGSYSGISLAQMSQPQSVGVNPRGATGSTTWAYSIVSFSSNGNTAGVTPVSISNGNATLTTTNFNQILWFGSAGAVKYCVWRTTAGGTPNTTGNVGCISALMSPGGGLPFNYTVNASGSGNQYLFNDSGLVGDSAVLPSTNTTGGLVLGSGTYLSPPVAPIAGLAGCSSAVEGFSPVANNCNAACTAGGTCTAGGSTHCQLYCNGSAYVETGR